MHHFELQRSVRYFLEILLRHRDLKFVSYWVGPVWVATLLNDACLDAADASIKRAFNADESVWWFESALWVLESDRRLDFYI